MNKKIIKQTKYCNILEQVKVADNEYTYTVEKIYIEALRSKMFSKEIKIVIKKKCLKNIERINGNSWG